MGTLRTRRLLIGSCLGMLLAAARPFCVEAGEAETAGAPAPLRIAAATEKVCQLTGDTDWESGTPTAARTFTRFGLDATDLGSPVEHDGKLVLLFGDSWPPPHGGGPAGEVPPDDAVGVTHRERPPLREDGRCLDLEIHHAARRFTPATIVGPTRVKQGFFNVPSGGVSVGRSLYGFFWTDHCSAPSPLRRMPGDPLARPRPTPGCPETDARNSVGRSLIARSDDEGRTFTRTAPMPIGFVYATAVNTRPLTELPVEQRLGVFVFAVPRYRASVPYLAYAPVETFADTSTWRFYTGLGPGGQPTWVDREQWREGRRLPGGRSALGQGRWNPPGEPELFVPKLEAGRSVGELSVTWNRELRLWLMLYGGPGGILARVARAPWGPWSEATRMLGGEDGLACRLFMSPAGCGDRRDYWPRQHESGHFVAGGPYAPYVLERYTTRAESGEGRGAALYWLVSTWNPYQVSVVRTTVVAESPHAPGAPR